MQQETIRMNHPLTSILYSKLLRWSAWLAATQAKLEEAAKKREAGVACLLGAAQ